MDDVFVNRISEMDQLRGRLRGLEHRGAAILLVGEPGIGKSALVNALTTEAIGDGLRVVRATGVPSETHLPYAGLGQLLQPLIDSAEELPSAQRTALLAALGHDATGESDFYAVALAALSLLRDSATAGPLLIVAEDLQWLDQLTVRVLSFVGRRIELDPIILLMSSREALDGMLFCEELVLMPLNQEHSIELLDRLAPDLEPALRKRLLDESQGNPLALVELAGQHEELPATAPIDTWVPVTTRINRAFESRLETLPVACRLALRVAAVNDSASIAEVLLAVSQLGGQLGPAAFDPALEARLIEIRGAAVVFRHPLVRSAIYHASSLRERHQVHLALSRVVPPGRAVWHEAAASLEPNDSIARKLDEVAATALQQGGTLVAAQALRRAADLSEDDHSRARRFIGAAEAAAENAATNLSRELLDQAFAFPLSPSETARAAWLRQQIDARDPHDLGAVESGIDVAHQMRAAGDESMALDVLVRLAYSAVVSRADANRRALIRDALALCDAGPLDPRRLVVEAVCTPAEESEGLLRHIAEARSQQSGNTAALRLLMAAAGFRGWTEAVGEMADELIELLRAQGQVRKLCDALIGRGWASWSLGDWDGALESAAEAYRLGTYVDRHAVASMQTLMALILTCRGDFESAVRTLNEIAPDVRPPGSMLAVQADHVQGILDALQGRTEDALRWLAPPQDARDRGYDSTGVHTFLPFYIDAAVACGAVDQARALVVELERVGWKGSSPDIGASLAYARAVLAEDGGEELFQEALAFPPLTRRPLLNACLLLAYGSALRRRRSVRESRTHLREARDLFDALGAQPWAERARQELRAGGEASEPAPSRVKDTLTPQELEIARLAAQGLTNREIGQQLYLSHRTIGTHLYRIFPKLGIASRHDLAEALSSPRTSGTPSRKVAPPLPTSSGPLAGDVRGDSRRQSNDASGREQPRASFASPMRGAL